MARSENTPIFPKELGLQPFEPYFQDLAERIAQCNETASPYAERAAIILLDDESHVVAYEDLKLNEWEAFQRSELTAPAPELFDVMNDQMFARFLTCLKARVARERLAIRTEKTQGAPKDRNPAMFYQKPPNQNRPETNHGSRSPASRALKRAIDKITPSENVLRKEDRER